MWTPSAHSLPPLPAGLYIIATPIGNLKDITLRALETLQRLSWLACEDTRVTHTLLSAYGLHLPLHTCNAHTEAALVEKIIAATSRGEAVGLVSDAGTPLISDPGAVLVPALVAAGVPIHTLPGASAVITALTISNLPTDGFTFAGFLPPKSGARQKALQGLLNAYGTLVLYDRGSRVGGLLADALAIFGDRPTTIARELTKLHEDIRRGTLASLAEYYAADTAEERGEFVIMIAPASAPAEASEDVITTALRDALTQHSLKDAVQMVSGSLNVPRKQVYALALQL